METFCEGTRFYRPPWIWHHKSEGWPYGPPPAPSKILPWRKEMRVITYRRDCACIAEGCALSILNVSPTTRSPYRALPRPFHTCWVPHLHVHMRYRQYPASSLFVGLLCLSHYRTFLSQVSWFTWLLSLAQLPECTFSQPLGWVAVPTHFFPHKAHLASALLAASLSLALCRVGKHSPFTLAGRP